MGTILLPSDFASIFQESSGITAGAVGSTVGLITDQRYSLARGAELVTNGDGSTVTGWTAGGTTTLESVGGVIKASGTADGAFFGQNLGAFTAGQTIEIYFDSVSDGTSKAAQVQLGTSVGNNSISSVGTVAFGTRRRLTHRFTGNVANCYIWFYPGFFGSANYVLIDNISVKEILGSHGAQTTPGNRPLLAAGGKIDYDGVDDALVITFPSDMGANCTVGRSVPNGEATILTGQTITTTYTDSTDHCGLVIINRALTATETNQLRRWLNRRAG